MPVTHEHVEDLTGHQAADLASYIPEFFLFLGMSWSLAQSASALNIALFWMLILASMLAGGLAWRRRQTLDAAIAAAGPAAFAVTLPIHLAYGATSLGYSIPAASFRYYLPLWPFLAHTVAFGVAAAARPWQRFLFASVLFAAIAAGWLSR